MTTGAIVPLASGIEPAAVFPVIGGESVLARVVRALVGPNRVSESHVVIVPAEPLAAGVRDCLAASGLTKVAVTVAPATADRWQCLRVGLDYLAQQELSPDHVLLGDHRHPLSHGGVTDRVIAGLRGGDPAVMPAVLVTDSVKAVDALGSVRGTIDRSGLRAVQFPRGYATIALSNLIDEGLSADVDELDAALRVGVAILTVDGEADAVRVELPADAELLAATTCRPG